MASVIPAKSIQAPEPATPLERLRHDRAVLTDELTGLQASAARLRETANAEASVIQEIGELGRAEIAAMTAWAAGGCIGDAPTPDQKQRRALAEKLSSAQAAAAAAKAAGRGIDQKITDVSDRLRAVNAQLEQAALETAEAEHAAIIAQYEANCEEGRKLAAKIHGLANFYGEMGQTLMSRGDQDGGTAYVRRSSALMKIKLPNPGVSLTEIQTAGLEWRRRIDALRRGA